MILRYCFAALAVALLALAVSAVACGGSSSGNDGGMDGPVHDAMKPCVDAGPILIALSVTETHDSGSSLPVALVPPFSSEIHDYYVHCPADSNALTVSMEANSCNESLLQQPMTTAPKTGKQVLKGITVKAHQAVVAVAKAGATTNEYWVRCLPPDFPPIQMVAHPEAGTPTPGYYLVGNFEALKEGSGAYAMVLDGRGVPVWYHDEPKGGVCDVDNIVDGGISYIPTKAQYVPLPFELFQLAPLGETNIAPTGSLPLDIHELQVLPNGNYIGITWPVETADLTGFSVTLTDGGSVAGGPNSTIVGCNLVEFTKAGTVIWTWQGSAHLDPAKVTVVPEIVSPSSLPEDSGVTDGGIIIGPYHCNSIDVDPHNSNLVLSVRQANSFVYIEKATGNVLWKMGGTDAGTLDPGVAYVPVPSPSFNGQHDVRLQPHWSPCAGGQITLYDDETFASGARSRAVVYDVSLGGKSGCDGGIAEGGKPTSTQTWQYPGPAANPAAASGSFRISSDGSRVIGWGLYTPPWVFTEVDDAGKALLEFESPLTPGAPLPMGSYRAIKVPLGALSLDAMRKTAGLSTP